METKIVAKSLAQSLVGCSIEFRDGKKLDRLNSGPALTLLRNKITSFCSKAYQARASVSVVSLACCQLYYLKQSNYFSVRSAIELKRLREKVLDLINEGADKMESALISALNFPRLETKLSGKMYEDNDREVIVDAVKYFVGVYPSRTKNFKSYLTRDEFAYVL